MKTVALKRAYILDRHLIVEGYITDPQELANIGDELRMMCVEIEYEAIQPNVFAAKEIYELEAKP